MVKSIGGDTQPNSVKRASDAVPGFDAARAGSAGATPGPRSPAAVAAASIRNTLVDIRMLANESVLRVLALDRYPELMEGDTTLAYLLRRFMIESLAAGMFFRFEPDITDSVSQVQTPSESDNSYSPPQSGPSAY